MDSAMECYGGVKTDCANRKKWMEGKPPLAALLASAPVLAADECFTLLQICVGNQAFPVKLWKRNVDEWLPFYTDRLAISRTIVESFSEKLFALSQVNDVDLIEFLIGDGCMTGKVAFLDDSFWQTALDRAELRFFFAVWMPCVLLYGESPAKLLDTIGRGGQDEWENVEKLVGLDPLIVQHPGIAELLNCEDAKLRRERSAMLADCLHKSLPKISKRQVKAMLAACMSRVSEILGSRFAEPDIRALYDAITCDRGQGLRDTDLPESSEAFSKAIQRYRPYWQLPDVPDKDIHEAVRALEAMLS